ncbi:9524_t:CDS:2 [Ambispora leptoticha]|uniref:9524_t:CDS:1 n=1 Tax=Ambispora leptoticha TaxID=144679 RepID=A0A9N9AGS3_9GLOM|nr:9524_t:CDS:2 [Ambispora leptoticha]
MGNGPSKLKEAQRKRFRARNQRESLSSTICSTASRENSSNQWYRFSYGRRYQNVENPNDEDEMARLQLLHYLVKSSWQSDFSSPIAGQLESGNCRVLDCGCGPGTWLMELGSDNPDSYFTGIDCCPVFPTDIKPRNVEFQCANILDGLPFDDDTFDFVHMRFMVGSFTSEQWNFSVIPELVRVCKPGGFLECMESDMKWMHSGPATECLMKTSFSFLASHGIEGIIHPHLHEYLRRTNRLANIHYAHKNIPVGKPGELTFQVAQQTLEASKVHLSEFLQISHDEYDELIRIACREFEEYKTMVTMFRFWAQKI